ncbi:hypothetical protein [Pseudoponticoccus marisrubri]|uniref:Uncharacterized protein n=1 Tax=Pseudoponticoccus marisrubri TaxID=1685382 RepID=A0A0W7WM73_9RHOB|nr:hypothetical protein [Pseudoponticoccus marisrubri]KUF11658.1 hypothetical protein AVJ23_07870 [Pseudoponticoccus marisrubri]
MTKHFFTICALSLALSGPVAAQEMIGAEAMSDYITGKAYQGVNPETMEVVASVVYHADGSSTLWMAGPADAAPKDEPGSYRIEGNTYCTRYENFRDNSENCFTLEDIGDGRTQAYYTDGRTALILQPIEIPDRFR